jgi:hypothetical protein
MRPFVRLLLAVFVAGIALQCQDRQGPTEVDSTGLQTATAESDINDLLGDLFDGGLENAAKSQARNMFRQFGRGLEADAQAKAIALVDFILEKHANGQTSGDDEDVLAVIIMILEYVGYDTSALENYEGDPDDLAIGMCGPGGCTVVTGNEHAGVMVPAGAFDEEVVIIIQRLPDFPPIVVDGLAPAVTNFYPLPSGLDQYPQFYDIYTIPDDVELNAGFFADVGLCVLEQSDGWEQGAPDDVLADLVLAHPAPDGPGTGNCDADIECLPIVNVVGLIDCGDLEEAPELGFRGLLDDFTRTLVGPFSPTLLYASPGELGGQASSFSPFAAVDPTSGGCEIC